MVNLTCNDADRSKFLDPFRELDELMRVSHLHAYAGESRMLPEFRMDLNEDARAYYLEADLPGMSREDIAVAIAGNLVTITARTKPRDGNTERTPLCTERHVGTLARRFTVRNPIDEAGARAVYDDGVLALVLPKKTLLTVEVH